MTPKSKSKWFLLPFFVFFLNISLFSQVTLFEEDFTSASGNTPPSGWTITNNPGGNASQIWDFSDTTPNVSGGSFSGNYAILDSDGYGNGNSQNVTLTSVVFDASTYTDLTLSFSNYFRYYTSGESGTIEIYNGSSWVNVDTFTSNTNYPTAAVRSYNINTLANGASDAQIRFTYVGSWGYYWAIDNVKVTGVSSVPLIPITITADAKSKGVGTSDPTLTYTITSGSLSDGDTLTGSLSRISGEAIGTYTINQGTLNNPAYDITYVSALFTITELDTDGDTIPDSTDLDDDNDGILDTDENCILPGAANPTGDAESWVDAEYSVYGIGSNTNGLGYQESGFQQAAYQRGINLTVLDDSSTNYLAERISGILPLTTNDKVYFGINPTTSSNDGEVTFTSTYYAPDYDSGAGVGCSSNTVGNNSELKISTLGEFVSGSTTYAIDVTPERGAITGDSYSIHINFNTNIYAFSFDINDVFDTTPGSTPPSYELEVFADGKLLAFMTADNFGNDNPGTMELYRGDKTTLVNNAINIGNNTEANIGFIHPTAITHIEIRTTIVSGETSECARDRFGIDNFAYGTTAQSCFADDLDFDGDGLNNDKDIDSDNDGVISNTKKETYTEIKRDTPSNNNNSPKKSKSTTAQTHRVARGETLYSISKRYGLSVSELRTMNNMSTADVLQYDQVLNINSSAVDYNEPRIVNTNIPNKPVETRSTNASTHTVSKGETLFSISQQYGLSVGQLKSMNGLNNNTISIGQKLKVGETRTSKPVVSAGTHVVRAGETLYSISKKYNATVAEVKAWNNLNSNEISIGQVLEIR